LAALGLLMLGRPILALGGLVAAAALLTVALRLRYGGADHAGPDHRRFGRGPYASADGSPNPELLGRLADIVRQLREAAIAGKWPLDWKDFDGLLAGADQAAAAGDLLGAARGQLRAISSLMAQLRAKRDVGSDSGVFL